MWTLAEPIIVVISWHRGEITGNFQALLFVQAVGK